MSEYESRRLLCSDSYLFTQSYLNLIVSYIPPTIRNKTGWPNISCTESYRFENDGADHIQKLFDISNHQLRMYGSVKDLCDSINIYRNIPVDHEAFSFDSCQPYSTSPLLYKNSKGDLYICKHDTFVFMQHILFYKDAIITKVIFCRSLLAIFLKHHAQKLGSTNEFVKYSDETFRAIQQDLNYMILEKPKKDSKKVDLSFADFSVDTVMKRFVGLLPPGSFKDEKNILRWGIQEILKLTPSNFKEPNFQAALLACKTLFDALDVVFEKYAFLFKPNSHLENITNARTPLIIRVFQDGTKQFVAHDELKLLDGGCADDGPEMNVLYTVSKKDALEMLNVSNKTHPVEFIYVSILRSCHRALFVRDARGVQRKLAVDVFFEMLYELIVGVKIFQKMKAEDIHVLHELLTYLNKEFFDGEVIYFLHFTAIEDIEEYARKKFEYLSSRPAKDIRNAKKDGFSAQNLKNELVNLGLLSFFPDILNHADYVYRCLVDCKMGQTLQTCDLFTAVVQCQMICFFKQNPKWAKFIHDQNGCDRIICFDCPCRNNPQSRKRAPFGFVFPVYSSKGEPLTPRSIEPTAKQESMGPSNGQLPTAKPEPIVKTISNSPVEEIARPPPQSVELSVESSTKATANTPTATSSCSQSELQEGIAQSVELVNAVLQKTRNQKKRGKKKLSKEESQPETPKVEPQPESASCSKCPRTSEMCQEAKKKLETCEKKLAIAEKELKKYKEQGDWKKVRRDMEEELEESKKKVFEMEKQMKNMKEQGDKKVEKLKQQAEKLRTSKKAEQEKAIAERENLQKKLTDSMKTNEKWSNDYRDLSHLSSDKDLTIQKLQRELAAAREPSVEMRRVLADLQDKFQNKDKLVSDTRGKVMRLINLPTSESVKQRARDEEALFLHKHAEWEQAIKKNIAIIQGNVHVTQEDLVPVPETPGLSKMLENELVIAEKENESLGKACLVCLDEKSQRQNLFKCPHCPTTFHLKCIINWIKSGPNNQCPSCKKNLNC